MKGNQNLPNKQITSNKMKGKPLPIPYRSRSHSSIVANTTHQPPTIIAAPPRAPQPELINY